MGKMFRFVCLQFTELFCAWWSDVLQAAFSGNVQKKRYALQCSDRSYHVCVIYWFECQLSRRMQTVLKVYFHYGCKRVYYFANVYLNKKLHERNEAELW